MNLSKKQLCEQRTKAMKEYCAKAKVYCEEFNSKSYRLARLGKIIDYYPLSNKCFWHSNHEWGAVENIEAFLKFEYPM